MSIHSLIDKFLELPDATVCRGPKHPRKPVRSLEASVNQFLEQYPFLRRDLGYVEFLQCYSGAYLIRPNYELGIDIFGFAEDSTQLVGDDEPLIDEGGYLTFCRVLFRVQPGGGFENVQTLGFAFDTTLKRKPGIYRQVVGKTPGLPVSTAWYCEAFSELLRDLIDKRGRLL